MYGSMDMRPMTDVYLSAFWRYLTDLNEALRAGDMVTVEEVLEGFEMLWRHSGPILASRCAKILDEHCPAWRNGWLFDQG